MGLSPRGAHWYSHWMLATPMGRIDTSEIPMLPRHSAAPLLVVVLALTCAAAAARQIHVAPAGDDASPGTPDKPLKTLAAATRQLQPGDTCIVHAGTYRESVRPARSGAAEAPIRFIAAAGAEPVITGADPVTGWQRHDGGIWKARIGRDVDQVFVDGRAMTLARTPNAGDDPWKPETMDLEADGTAVKAAALTQAADAWKGATLWAIGPRAWVAGTATVAASAPGSLTLESKVPFWGKDKGVGYIEGPLAALDAAGEWAVHDGWLYLWAPGGADPSRHTVEATNRRWAFDLSGLAHIHLEGLRIVAASVNTDAAEGCIIARCRFRWASFRRDIRGGFNRDRGITIESDGLGVVLGGKGNTLRDSVVAWAYGDGVSVYGEGNRVENCVIHHINLSASDCAPVDMTGTGHVVTGCTIFEAGRSGVLHRKLKAGTITHNHIHHVGRMTNDLGGTYAFQTDADGTVIAYNRIHDVRCKTGVGIYVDNFCKDILIHHNLVTDNQDSGVRINTPSERIRVIHNTLAANGNAMNWWGRDNNSSMPGTEVVNNILLGRVRLGEEAKVSHNLTESEAQFVAPERGDYRLQAGSPAVDAGTAIEGVTGKTTGKAPDVGCYERGVDPWKAGSTLDRKLWDEAGW